MKCVKCGAELKEGCVYCSVCGNEVQILPDYGVLEDDYLHALLKEEDDVSTHQKTGEQSSLNSGKKDKKKPGTPIFIVCFILFAAILTGIIVNVTIRHKNANSYEYQVGMAKQEEVDKNYENALHYYKTALSLQPGDVPVRLAMADIYMKQKDYDSAMVLLVEVIELDASNKEAYKSLIAVYEDKKDYDSIAELASGITDAGILQLFDGYLVAAPVISPVEGEYEECIDVTLYSMEGFDIYYTLDGSVPDAANGILYDEKKKISLEESGDYEISAVCVNEKGICSEVVTVSYEIEVLPPEYAVVTPDGGRFSGETLVTITAEEGCSIYYTWDGTDPTELSARYEMPLELPTGNNILSVLVINDKTKLDSGVYRTNFIYYP